MNTNYRDPWPDIAAARTFLAFLTGVTDEDDYAPESQIDPDSLARWLIERDLGSLAYARCRDVYPELADRLQTEPYLTAGQNSLHWRNLKQINNKFADAGITAVLLKGAALAGTVYDGIEQRSMTDVDLWLREQDLGQGCSLMAGLDFYAKKNVHRPLALPVRLTVLLDPTEPSESLPANGVTSWGEHQRDANSAGRLASVALRNGRQAAARPETFLPRKHIVSHRGTRRLSRQPRPSCRSLASGPLPLVANMVPKSTILGIRSTGDDRLATGCLRRQGFLELGFNLLGHQ